MTSKITPLRYVGGGAFIIGVPARDLTAAEARHYRKLIGDSPLYEPAEDGPEDEPEGEPTGEAQSEAEEAPAEDKPAEKPAKAHKSAGKTGEGE